MQNSDKKYLSMEMLIIITILALSVIVMYSISNPRKLVTVNCISHQITGFDRYMKKAAGVPFCGSDYHKKLVSQVDKSYIEMVIKNPTTNLATREALEKAIKTD